MIGYFTFLSTMTSIIQQLHTMILWDDVKTAQWEHARDNVGSVEVAIAGPSVGLDLVLFYIRTSRDTRHVPTGTLTGSKNIFHTTWKHYLHYSGLALLLSLSMALQISQLLSASAAKQMVFAKFLQSLCLPL